MKKLLAILGSIGLTSTAASAVIACGNGSNANVGGNKSIVVNPDIANGSYDSDSKTFTAQYGSDKYQAHKMSFSLTKVVLKAENIQVVNAQGTNVDQESGLWSFWISENGANTVFEIEDSSLNGAIVQINLDNHLPTRFKIAIHQDQNLVVNNVINGSYDPATTTLTAKYQSNQYSSDNKMRFLLANVSLSESNFNVIKGDGTKTEVKDGLWSFSVTDNTTTVHIDDYHLDQGTIQINLDGYNSITFKIVINQSKEIAIDNTVANGSYNSNSKTFTASYPSAQYDDHKMSFTINDLTLSASNVVVKAVDEQVTTGWSLSTTTSTTTITIDDYHLDQATIEIKDVEGYWPVILNIVIPQDKNLVVGSVTNGGYAAATKTFTTAYGSSVYQGHAMSFVLNEVVLNANNIVVQNSAGTITTNGWSFTTSDKNTTITINDYNLNGATISIQDVEGYWPVTFNVTIPQDQNVIVNSDVSNGNYDDSTKTFTADYGSSTYQEEGHELSFKIKGLALQGKDFVLVKNNDDQEIATGWKSVVSGNDTIITIDDYNLNNAKVIVQNVDGYWSTTFKIIIPQDQIFTPNVVNGNYDASSQTLTAMYGNSKYNDHAMSFALNGVTLSTDNIVVKNGAGQSVAQNSGWSFAVDDSNTAITIDDYNLNGATISIQDVEGYWPVTFNVTIPQDQNVIVNSDVSNGNYDESSKTLTADYSGVEYDSNHMLFSIRNIILKEQNIVVKDASGQVIEQASDRWSSWTANDGASTVFEIKDGSMNGATITIQDVEGYWPATFKIIIS